MDDAGFRLLAENALDMICLVESNLSMSYASPSCEIILGWKPHEMVGKGPDSFVHPDDLSIVAAAHKKLEVHGVDRSPTVVRMRRKSGGYIWMEINARIIAKEDGAYQVVLVMRDISARCGIPDDTPDSRELSLRMAKRVISQMDLYVTKSGHIAFLQGFRETLAGETVFFGSVLDHIDGKTVSRRLEWSQDGQCINSDDERDWIVRKA